PRSRVDGGARRAVGNLPAGLLEVHRGGRPRRDAHFRARARAVLGVGLTQVDLRVGWDSALLSMVLAIALSMGIAWAYVLTYHGPSYSRSFVQTVALAGVISSMVMLAIGNDIARGLGLVGALTVVRFRSTLKDTRDLLFVFASLAVGVACGVQAF